MHMGSGFCLCVGADFLSARGVGGGGRFTDRRCRGRRPRRPAEVSGDGRYTGGMNPSPYGYTVDGSFPGGGGGVKTPPYKANR